MIDGHGMLSRSPEDRHAGVCRHARSPVRDRVRFILQPPSENGGFPGMRG